MHIITNELKSAKLLRNGGIPYKQSEAIVSMIASMDIHNIYSIDEVDTMLSETVEKVFRKFDSQFDKKFDEQSQRFREQMREQRREFDEKMAVEKEHINRTFDELKSSKNWIIGTIITVGMGLAAYLSALIKLSH